jgi:hypothetical protein
VLWNLGASLEFMWVDGWRGGESFEYTYYDGYDTSTGTRYFSYHGASFLLGLGTQTGFTFRVNPYTSLDLNGLLRFPFGTVVMRPEYDRWGNYSSNYGSYNVVGSLSDKSFWPFTAGIELALTFWLPYRSR